MFWRNFIKLCAEAGKSPTRVALDLGLSSGTASNWKRGAIPQERILNRIADYFGVPVEDLTAEAPEPMSLTHDEEQVVLDYRGLNREGQGRILDLLSSMKRSGRYQPNVDYIARGFDSGAW